MTTLIVLIREKRRHFLYIDQKELKKTLPFCSLLSQNHFLVTETGKTIFNGIKSTKYTILLWHRFGNNILAICHFLSRCHFKNILRTCCCCNCTVNINKNKNNNHHLSSDILLCDGENSNLYKKWTQVLNPDRSV
jgi:hypothetical protein